MNGPFAQCASFELYPEGFQQMQQQQNQTRSSLPQDQSAGSAPQRPAAGTPIAAFDPNTFDFEDPSILRAARSIYHLFQSAHPDFNGRPLGVAINRRTYRGKLIFTGKPVLLPQECFVPFSQIDVGAMRA